MVKIYRDIYLFLFFVHIYVQYIFDTMKFCLARPRIDVHVSLYRYSVDPASSYSMHLQDEVRIEGITASQGMHNIFPNVG